MMRIVFCAILFVLNFGLCGFECFAQDVKNREEMQAAFGKFRLSEYEFHPFPKEYTTEFDQARRNYEFIGKPEISAVDDYFSYRQKFILADGSILEIEYMFLPSKPDAIKAARFISHQLAEAKGLDVDATSNPQNIVIDKTEPLYTIGKDPKNSIRVISCENMVIIHHLNLEKSSNSSIAFSNGLSKLKLILDRIRFVHLFKNLTEDNEEFFGQFPMELRGEWIRKIMKYAELRNEFLDKKAAIYKKLDSHIPVAVDGVYAGVKIDYEEMALQNRDSIRWEMLVWQSRFKEPYPELFDPAKKDEYWMDSTKTVLWVFDVMIKNHRELINGCDAEMKRIESLGDKITTRDLVDDPVSGIMYGNKGLFAYNMGNGKIVPTDEMLKALFAGDPVSPNPNIGIHLEQFFKILLRLDKAAATRWEQELNRSIADWNKAETPNLKKLAIKSEEIQKWDGSTSLIPLAKLIIAHSEGTLLKRSSSRYEENGFTFIRVSLADDGTEIKAVAPLFRESGNFLNKIGDEPPFFSQTHESIISVIKKEKDLAFSTRMPSPDELEAAKKDGIELVCTPFAKDALVFLKNRYNPIESLTEEQIKGIFTGKYTNWQEVGGFGGKIVPLVRNRNSGSEELMQELVTVDSARNENIGAARAVNDRGNTTNFQPREVTTMMGIFDQLDGMFEGIGYSVSYYERIMVPRGYTRTIAVDGIAPDADNLASGKYPYLYECILIHRKNPGARIDKFREWLLSEEGQSVVKESGYVPVK